MTTPHYNQPTLQNMSTHSVHVLTDTIIIGRHEDCNLVLKSERGASRKHARITVQNDAVVLMDLGSLNGTLVNGREINRAVQLVHGDILIFDEQEYQFANPLASTQNSGDNVTVIANKDEIGRPDRIKPAIRVVETTPAPASANNEFNSGAFDDTKAWDKLSDSLDQLDVDAEPTGVKAAPELRAVPASEPPEQQLEQKSTASDAQDQAPQTQKLPTQEPSARELKAQEPNTQEPEAQESKAPEPKVREAQVQQFKIQEPELSEQQPSNEPLAEAPHRQGIKAKEPKTEKPGAHDVQIDGQVKEQEQHIGPPKTYGQLAREQESKDQQRTDGKAHGKAHGKADGKADGKANGNKEQREQHSSTHREQDKTPERNARKQPAPELDLPELDLPGLDLDEPSSNRSANQIQFPSIPATSRPGGNAVQPRRRPLNQNGFKPNARKKGNWKQWLVIVPLAIILMLGIIYLAYNAGFSAGTASGSFGSS